MFIIWNCSYLPTTYFLRPAFVPPYLDSKVFHITFANFWTINRLNNESVIWLSRWPRTVLLSFSILSRSALDDYFNWTESTIASLDDFGSRATSTELVACQDIWQWGRNWPPTAQRRLATSRTNSDNLLHLVAPILTDRGRPFRIWSKFRTKKNGNFCF